MHVMFRKVALLEISRNILCTGVSALEYTSCNATKNKLLTKFLKSALKLTEYFQEVNSNVVFTGLQTEAFSQACF